MNKKIPNISYSSYSMYKQCPREFWYQYMQKEVKQTESCGYFSFIGTIFQYVFEKITNDRLYRIYSYDELVKMINSDLQATIDTCTVPLGLDTDRNIKGIGFYDGMEGQWSIDITKYTNQDILDEFENVFPNLEKWLNKPHKILDATVCEPYYKKEYKSLEGRPYKMVGYIDFLIKRKKLSIIDGKRNTFVTYKKSDTEKKNPEFPFISPTQLHFYIILTNSLDSFEFISFWDYTKNKIIRVPVTKEDVLKTKEEIDKTVDLIWKDEQWNKHPSQQNCKFCSYKEHCHKQIDEEGIEI